MGAEVPNSMNSVEDPAPSEGETRDVLNVPPPVEDPNMAQTVETAGGPVPAPREVEHADDMNDRVLAGLAADPGSYAGDGAVEAEEASDALESRVLGGPGTGFGSGAAGEGSVTAGELREKLAGEPRTVLGGDVEVADGGSASAELKADAPDYVPPETVEQPEPEGHPDPLDKFEADPAYGEESYALTWRAEQSAFHAALADWHKEIDDLFAPFERLGAPPISPAVFKHAMVRTLNFLTGGLLDAHPAAPPSLDDVPAELVVPENVPAESHAENPVISPGEHTSFDVPTTEPEVTQAVPGPEQDTAATS